MKSMTYVHPSLDTWPHVRKSCGHLQNPRNVMIVKGKSEKKRKNLFNDILPVSLKILPNR
jgi:hypothetical protein